MSLNNRALQPEVAPPRTSAVSQGVVAEAPVSWGVRCVRELAFHDWVVVVYLSILSVTVAMVDASPVRSRCLGHVALMLAFCVAVLALVRGGIAKGTFWSPLAYRVAVYGTVQISYFELRELLPLVNSTSLDAQLSYVDESIFHFEPSLFLDRFISRRRLPSGSRFSTSDISRCSQCTSCPWCSSRGAMSSSPSSPWG